MRRGIVQVVEWLILNLRAPQVEAEMLKDLHPSHLSESAREMDDIPRWTYHKLRRLSQTTLEFWFLKDSISHWLPLSESYSLATTLTFGSGLPKTKNHLKSTIVLFLLVLKRDGKNAIGWPNNNLLK